MLISFYTWYKIKEQEAELKILLIGDGAKHFL